MKTPLIILFTLVNLSLFSQLIHVKTYTTPTVDGDMKSMEWEGSYVIIPSGNGQRPVQVYYQISDTAFYFAFAGNLNNQLNPNFPEVYLDINHDRTSNWNADDLWFHISATDCYSQGKAADYSNCIKDPVDWTGKPNWPSGGVGPDTVEILIPFSKIGFDPVQNDTIGIAFGVTNTSTRYDLWPVGAQLQNPSSWGHAVIEHNTSIKSPQNDRRAQPLVYPNPFQLNLNIRTDQSENIQIISNQGLVVRSLELKPGENQVFFDQLNPGFYWLKGSDWIKQVLHIE